MSHRYVLDEHLRGTLHRAIQRRNAASAVPLDVVRVGDAAGIPLGVSDPDLLAWAEWNQRIVVSRDRRTMIAFFNERIAAGQHSPGLLIVLRGATFQSIMGYLELADQLVEPGEWRDRIEYTR